MKILVTGGTGFIGSNLVRALLNEHNSEVYITARPSSSLWRLEGIKEQLNGIVHVDLSNRKEVFDLIKKLKPVLIFHLASYGTQPDQLNKDELIKTNLNSTVNLLDAAVEYGVSKFINTGSSSEYGLKDSPMKEDDLCKPYNLYGITKLAATNYCSMIGNLYSYPVCTLRLFTVFGEDEGKQKLFASIVNALNHNKAPHLSNPNSIRDFIEVDRVVHVYKKMAQKEFEPGSIYNLGSGKQQTIGEFYQSIASKLGKAHIEPIWGGVPSRSVEPKAWQADISKLLTFLGEEY